MTLDDLAKHGLRVKPLEWDIDGLGEGRFRDALDIQHAIDIAAALEPIAPPQPRAIVSVGSSVEVCFECDIADCHHIRARRAASPDVAQAARVDEFIAQLDAFGLFLSGSGVLDGVSFGDKAPGKVGLYWWRRTHLPVIAEAIAALRAIADGGAE